MNYLLTYLFTRTVQVLGEFPPSTRTLQDVSGNLTIIDVALQDDGVYECVASNLAASIVTVTVLIVHCQCTSIHGRSETFEPKIKSLKCDNYSST